ncbi:unnamed protein product [Schistosoma margrebowiei]|uniref:Rhodanese domain-containing protein n=2 Tax=Schistosoma margrebowiei TaxID=48269 RepID=A0AA84ZEB4_9TREM|nr:unnamed protein product [Schistosoma margrebowiei]
MDPFNKEIVSANSFQNNKDCLEEEETSNSVENIQRTFSDTTPLSLQNQLNQSSENKKYNLNLISGFTESDDKENHESPGSRRMLIPYEIMGNHDCLPESQYENDLCFPNSLDHYDVWTLNNGLHSPWPSIEVDQLANWLIEMKSMILKKSSIFPKSLCTLSHSFSSNSTSSSSSCSSSSSSSCSSCSYWSSSSSSEFTRPNAEQLNSKCNKRSKCCLQKLRYKHKLQNQQKMITLSKLKMNPKHFVIIDCRYPYEYNAGHIYSAINLSDWPNLYQYFFGIKHQSIETTEMDLSNSLYSTEQLIKPKPSHIIFILYCEFSTKRAPQLFYLLRNHDRALHFTSYPALNYPFVYILHGGYSTFYKNYPYLCEPCHYLQMHSRPDLLSIWHKHCKLVNRQSMNSNSQVYPHKNHHEMLNTHTSINQSTNRNIKVPFKSITNLFQQEEKIEENNLFH